MVQVNQEGGGEGGDDDEPRTLEHNQSQTMTLIIMKIMTERKKDRAKNK